MQISFMYLLEITSIKTFQAFIRKYERKIKLNLRFSWLVYQKCHTAFTHETCHITVAITRSANVETKTSSFETTIPRDSMCSLKRFYETLTFIYRERESVYEGSSIIGYTWMTPGKLVPLKKANADLSGCLLCLPCT